MNDVNKPQTIILIIYVDFIISMLFYEWFISSLNRDNLFLIDCWVVRRRSTKPRQNDPNKVFGRRSQPQQSAPLQRCSAAGSLVHLNTLSLEYPIYTFPRAYSILWYYAHIALACLKSESLNGSILNNWKSRRGFLHFFSLRHLSTNHPLPGLQSWKGWFWPEPVLSLAWRLATTSRHSRQQ